MLATIIQMSVEMAFFFFRPLHAPLVSVTDSKKVSIGRLIMDHNKKVLLEHRTLEQISLWLSASTTHTLH